MAWRLEGTIPDRSRAARDAGLVLILAAGAWAGTVVLARGMTRMTGTMGLGLGVFVPVWTLMMAAMMLPSMAPFSSAYAQRWESNRTARVAGLAAGYLAVWAAAALPTYALAWLAGWLTERHAGAAHALAVAVFAACGVYQLSRLKDRCLAHCRPPLALAQHGSAAGRLRDLRAGLRHGAYCLGCCWGLMVILVAVGVMNVAAMAGLAVMVLVEKTWARGQVAGRLAGVAALALAVAIIWLPWLAPGLHAAPPMMMG